MSKKDQLLDNFNGQARLFPLPNVVLFPMISQPLHIFEPRYRQMLGDALASDRLIAMGLLRPGWEESYHSAPAIHSVVCLGRVTQEQRLPDGRYNLVLEGLARARIIEEKQTDRLYRIAEVELLHEDPVRLPQREKALREHFADKLMRLLTDDPQLKKIVHSVLPL